MMELPDSKARARFATELDRNFLVIAPAGVGKTTALTERIVNLMMADLPSLVVVTFTKKAAIELKSRVLGELARRFPAAIPRLKSVFFGTIDSFFSLLLKEFGPQIGIPAQLDVVELGDETERDLWENFLDGYEANCLPPPIKKRFLQFHDWEKIAQLARRSKPIAAEDPVAIPAFPATNWSNHEWSETIPPKLRPKFFQWKWAMEQGVFIPMDGDDESLSFIPKPVRDPIRRWLETIGGILCNDMAWKYHHHKIADGFATFTDIRVGLQRLLSRPEILAQIRRRRYRILLDEAQDTDSMAFDLLLKLLPDHGEKFGPADGLFSLVGDPQQSIYLEDSQDFERFSSTCGRLLEGSVEKLIFCVTMRCPAAVIGQVNGTFSRLLTGENGQANFVEMWPKPQAIGGNVFGLCFANSDDMEAIGAESTAIADFLKDRTPADFGLETWSQFAILAARKAALLTLHRALRDRDLPAQVRVRSATFSDATLYRWICGLCHLLTHPSDENEAVAILREIFVISDRDMAIFARKNSDRPFKFALIGDLDGDDNCHRAMAALRELLDEIHGENNGSILALLERKLSLLERVLRIPDENPKEVNTLWQALVEFADMEDEIGHNFHQFADALATHFSQKKEAFSPDPNAIQLDTLHGSKGLEWPLVWLPFFNRPHQSHRQEGLILCSHSDQPALLFRNGPTYRADKFAHVNHLQRLFYVGMTRAKRTMILSSLQAEKIGKLAPSAFLNLDPARLAPPVWSRILNPQFKGPARNVVAANEAIPSLAPAELQAKFAFESPAFIQPSESADGLDKRMSAYGDWWHETLRYFPFHRPDQIAVYGEKTLASCPDRDRGALEMRQFLQSDFFMQLCHSPKIFTEFPFYFSRSGKIVHGFIDLLCIDPERRRATIIDWKTEQNSWAELLTAHRRQLLHYLDFARNQPHLKAFSIRAGIFSSRLGEVRFLVDESGQ